MKKRILIVIMGIGTIGFFIGGAGLDSEQWIYHLILAASSLILTGLSYGYYEICEKRGEKHKTAKKTIASAKEDTFRVWLTSTKLDVPVRG